MSSIFCIIFNALDEGNPLLRASFSAFDGHRDVHVRRTSRIAPGRTVIIGKGSVDM
jgi:hypothetical protein